MLIEQTMRMYPVYELKEIPVRECKQFFIESYIVSESTRNFINLVALL
ncbi:hypothetical protein NUACC26_009090 [Scytonema sp. NUACC26]